MKNSGSDLRCVRSGDRVQVAPLRRVAFQHDGLIRDLGADQLQERRIDVLVLQPGSRPAAREPADCRRSSCPRPCSGPAPGGFVGCGAGLLAAAAGRVGQGRGPALGGPDVVAAFHDVVAILEVVRDARRPDPAPVQVVAEAVRHRVALAAGGPVHGGDLQPTEHAVVDVDPVPVGDDRDVVRVGHLVAGEQALGDFEVLEVAAKPADAVEASNQPGPGTLHHGHAEDLQPLDRHVARLDQHAVRGATRGDRGARSTSATRAACGRASASGRCATRGRPAGPRPGSSAARSSRTHGSRASAASSRRSA